VLDCEGLGHGKTFWHSHLAALSLHSATCLVYVIKDSLQNKHINVLANAYRVATLAQPLASGKAPRLVVVMNKLNMVLNGTPKEEMESLLWTPADDLDAKDREDVKVRLHLIQSLIACFCSSFGRRSRTAMRWPSPSRTTSPLTQWWGLFHSCWSCHAALQNSWRPASSCRRRTFSIS
jgi:hypothetical protein